MMIPRVPGSTGTVVDLGCHTGWFCRQFARGGWKAIGIDRSKEWIGVARSLNGLFDVDADYRIGDIINDDVPKCDVALLLSAAMYLFDDPARGWAAMRRISEAAPMLFFDYGGMYADRMPPTFLDDLIPKTVYRHLSILGGSDFEQRPLYMATR